MIFIRFISQQAAIRGPPADELGQFYGEYVHGRSVSTYPTYNGKREGDPICDQYYLVHWANRSICAVADGCSWGVEPRDAAFKSVKLFGDYMRKYQREIVTLDMAPIYMLRAYLAAHNLIIEGRNEETLFDAGTTTM